MDTLVSYLMVVGGRVLQANVAHPLDPLRRDQALFTESMGLAGHFRWGRRDVHVQAILGVRTPFLSRIRCASDVLSAARPQNIRRVRITVLCPILRVLTGC